MSDPSKSGDDPLHRIPGRQDHPVFGYLRRRRHERLTAEPFPADWAAHLERNVPGVLALEEAERAWLEDLIQIFVAEKCFEGAGGLEVTDEMRVTVAAHACLLLIGHDETWVYPDLARIVLYPEAYVARKTSAQALMVTESTEVRLGESWDHGVVVLAWNAVRHGARDMRDGHNVAYHEFAHQLDQDFAAADGAPELPRGMCYGIWAEVLGSAFARLQRASASGRKPFLDAYGATHPAEFFAVATEAFFEKPVQMKKRAPDLYRQLVGFYRQDPAVRVPRAGASGG
jgi:Mlc titration factor MtfA (ptsG expression regulator)